MATRGYQSYRGRNHGKLALVIVLVLILLAAVGYLVAQEYMVYDDEGHRHLELPFLKKGQTEQPQQPEDTTPDDVNLIIDEPERPLLKELHARQLPDTVLTEDPSAVLAEHPEAVVIGNAKTLPMIKQFFPMEVEGRFQAVKEGDTLSLGRHELTFVMAPLVHWPEVMMTYDTTEKALFSADAFGTFGAMDGNIFADEVNFEQEWLDDARRYYTNIVGKYGTPVQNVLKKAAYRTFKI